MTIMFNETEEKVFWEALGKNLFLAKNIAFARRKFCAPISSFLLRILVT